MNRIYCARCGHPLYKRIYSNGNRLNWGCSGTKRYGKSFCEGINIPDRVLRGAWHFDENMYIGEKQTDKGKKEFTYLKEASWKRRHKKKEPEPIPENTETEYPYREKIFCGLCGSRLVRHVNTKNHKVIWVCNGRKRKGKDFCDGTRVPDTIIKGWGEIKKDIYIQRKDDKNGKKTLQLYQAEKAKRCREQGIRRYGKRKNVKIARLLLPCVQRMAGSQAPYVFEATGRSIYSSTKPRQWYVRTPDVIDNYIASRILWLLLFVV